MSQLTALSAAAPVSSENEDRRTAYRKSVAVRAQLIVPGQHILEGYTVDLSSGGVCVTVPFELPRGQECLVDLELAACGSSSEFHIESVVRYSIEVGPNSYRTGLQFGRLDEATAALVAALLK